MTTQEPNDIESLFVFESPERREQVRSIWHELEIESQGDPEVLREFQSVIRMLLLGELPQVPTSLRSAALSKLRPLLEPTATASTRVRAIGDIAARAGQRFVEEIRAALVLDSFAGAALPGIRSSTRLQPRQLLYESPLGSVHLQIETNERSGRVEVMGQFIPRDELAATRGRAVLLVEEQAMLAPMEDTGEFRFASVPAGILELRLELGDHALTIAPLPVTG